MLFAMLLSAVAAQYGPAPPPPPPFAPIYRPQAVILINDIKFSNYSFINKKNNLATEWTIRRAGSNEAVLRTFVRRSSSAFSSIRTCRADLQTCTKTTSIWWYKQLNFTYATICADAISSSPISAFIQLRASSTE